MAREAEEECKRDYDRDRRDFQERKERERMEVEVRREEKRARAKRVNTLESEQVDEADIFTQFFGGAGGGGGGGGGGPSGRRRVATEPAKRRRRQRSLSDEMDDIQECMELANEISDVLAAPCSSTALMDEGELMEELEELEQLESCLFDSREASFGKRKEADASFKKKDKKTMAKRPMELGSKKKPHLPGTTTASTSKLSALADEWVPDTGVEREGRISRFFGTKSGPAVGVANVAGEFIPILQGSDKTGTLDFTLEASNCVGAQISVFYASSQALSVHSHKFLGDFLLLGIRRDDVSQVTVSITITKVGSSYEVFAIERTSGAQRTVVMESSGRAEPNFTVNHLSHTPASVYTLPFNPSAQVWLDPELSPDMARDSSVQDMLKVIRTRQEYVGLHVHYVCMDTLALQSADRQLHPVTELKPMLWSRNVLMVTDVPANYSAIEVLAALQYQTAVAVALFVEPTSEQSVGYAVAIVSDKPKKAVVSMAPTKRRR
eukprot:NODE_336_length_1614_cov_81.617350_g304_i0.p1 GENE.NODE_336_length_1614_cov_81.617350_g304_i0~~NODE_336_length_1614_cov_81.617350_g304_i0.p1  ORF type:complete len:529 (-),score=115.24 NODE_336_length_1614_cov_81.617350_g304_i0:26-1507(-)